MLLTGWMVLCTVVFLCFPLSAQVENASSPARYDALPYYLDAISFASGTSRQSRLDIFIQVGYDQVKFVKTGDTYSGAYEMTLALFDDAGQLVVERVWTEQIVATTFEQTVSTGAHTLSQRVFEVAPGRYTIMAIFRDAESKASHRSSRTIQVSDFTQSPLALSDIMLVRRLTIEGEKRSIVPNVSPNVGNIGEGFHVFFEAYNDLQIDTVRFVTTVLNERKETVVEGEKIGVLTQGRNPVFLKVENTKLSLGDYTLFVRAYPLRTNAGATEYLAVTSRSFMVRWQGMPRGIADLDLAIDQLRYIAKDKELGLIKAGETPEERQKRFLEFWKTRDPNPNTARNEKMEEYYARVEYANKNFKHYIEGWRTDMGMVYIIFGAPSNVDRHPFDSNAKPYEVWSYYEMNHEFIFVDQSGFGDYRLVTPIWEVWQQARH